VTLSWSIYTAGNVPVRAVHDRVKISDMSTASRAKDLKTALAELAKQARSAHDLMSGIVKLLAERMPKYNWVGFYMLEISLEQPMLVLGPFQGAMTPHPRISLHQGVCGAAASTGKTVVVDDVSNDPRYLACSIETKSEVVVPIFVRGKVVGELDIDSHFLAAFEPEDRELVEYCANLVGQRLSTIPDSTD
jgi:L-methionine (R)-S-oxide reductase